MEHHINLVIVTGVVARDPRLDEADGKRCCRFTIVQEEPPYTAYIPVEVYGAKLIDDCAGITASMYVGIEGKLKWSAYTTRSGEKRSGLVVMARAVKQLRSPVLAPAVAINQN